MLTYGGYKMYIGEDLKVHFDDTKYDSNDCSNYDASYCEGRDCVECKCFANEEEDDIEDNPDTDQPPYCWG